MDIRIENQQLNWYLEIMADGSGYLGYGSNGFDMAEFPANTFGFNELGRKLRPRAVSEDRSSDRDCSIVFGGAGDGTSKTAMYIAAQLAQPLFEKAHEAVRSSPAAPRIAELWREMPPF